MKRSQWNPLERSTGKGEKTATYNLKLNDTVSFPRLCKDTYNGLGAKPKKRQTVGINGGYVTTWNKVNKQIFTTVRAKCVGV